MSDGAIQSIVVVGGGTAGWLTAAILAADHCAASGDGITVTLVESPNIPILGVGEGTWPSLRDTLRRIGLSETDFIRRCNASFKQGSRFEGWLNGSESDYYFHPFDAPPSPDKIDSHAMWQAGSAGVSYADAVGVQAALCEAGKAPKQHSTPEFAAVANYAYHLDAPAFADVLREHCTKTLGVQLVGDDVIDVVRDTQGAIASLELKNRGTLSGDLYVDCTGSKALLIGQALGAPLTDVSRFLFNDRALAIQVPYLDETTDITSHTNGTATEAGWVWDIALQNRRGVGHVFSSHHIDEARAREILTAYVRKTAPYAVRTGSDARLIKFRSAYRETPWVGNAVAIGMAQGFVEPLEASAIVMIELSARMLSDTLPPNRAILQSAADRFNERFRYRWARIIDFLKLHYVLSKRGEQYWADHRDRSTWSDRLCALIDRWRYESPSREDFTDALEIFPAASYAYVLYGMGFETNLRPFSRRKDSKDLAIAHMDTLVTQRLKFLSGLPGNRELIQHIMRRGLTKI